VVISYIIPILPITKIRVVIVTLINLILSNLSGVKLTAVLLLSVTAIGPY
jgi:hypothetical protein